MCEASVTQGVRDGLEETGDGIDSEDGHAGTPNCNQGRKCWLICSLFIIHQMFFIKNDSLSLKIKFYVPHLRVSSSS
jgi:hypothetical protein